MSSLDAPSYGSPPQAWGRLQPQFHLAQGFRFTPTGVGTALRVIPQAASVLGSPPQAWGRLHPHRRAGTPPRFTPTGVGTAKSPDTFQCRGSVHPHRRGDGDSYLPPIVGRYGSPPQAWGRLTQQQTQQLARRFTPTGVGTATRSGTVCPLTTVHPHRRGDGVNAPLVERSLGGSPPQAWGRQPARAVSRCCLRFTPTGVGTARA